MNINIWVVGISNQLFTRGFKLKQNFQNKELLAGPFCTFHSTCLNIGFRQSSFVWKCCAVNLSTLNEKNSLRFAENLFQS